MTWWHMRGKSKQTEEQRNEIEEKEWNRPVSGIGFFFMLNKLFEQATELLLRHYCEH